jgi:outer membrane receptor protein involved in Fe transport
LTLLALGAPPLVAQQPPAPPPAVPAALPPAGPAGRIAGRVLDRDTGRPLGGARVTVVGQLGSYTTDLDGRYRTNEVPAGVYVLRVALIGYQPVRVDSVRVVADEVAITDVSMGAAAIEVGAVTVEAEAVQKPSSDAGLLAIQQAAPTVSDGISAETMSRTPDADAADAVARVTGIAVFDNKYVIVRGLPERYSNTLLNGAELASPEPLRRVVPLDIFPASLLETIVTTKAATPDRPGDFAGGSVEIRTKEFPETFVLQGNISQGYNSLATLERIPLVPRRGTDFLGIDDGRRSPPGDLPDVNDIGPVAERFGESLRNVWTPGLERVLPDLGLGFNLGGQVGATSALGYVLSWTYNRKTEFVPDRTFSLFSNPDAPAERSVLYRESSAVVDWGGIANLSWRLGAASKLGWKNLYTRTAEEAVISDAGYDTENGRVIRDHQIVYTEQDFYQSQLSGEHQLALPRSRLEWRATAAWARRDEPDNRQAQYILDETTGEFTQASQVPSRVWTRFLDDHLHAMQGDWAFPISLRHRGDAEFKVGGLYRLKERAFDAEFFRISVNNLHPDARAVGRLPPELAFAPENIGGPLLFRREDAFAQSYDAADRIIAAYGMLDVPVLTWLRLVGGVRAENWRIAVFPGGRLTPDGPTARRYSTDLLWSGNLRLRFTDRMNLRLAAFRSVARPDARELSQDSYVPVASGCENQGNADLLHTAILNGDARWEWYPRPGELLSLSAFYKEFTDPIIEVVDTPGGGQCRVTYRNGTSATNYGLEIEVRRAFDFLPAPLAYLSAGANLTWVESRVVIPPNIGTYDPELDLQGQSRYLVNGNLAFNAPGGSFTATLLVNYFADRIARYGQLAGTLQAPDLIERGRVTIDAKVQQRLGPHLSWSLAGRNLTDEPVVFFHRGMTGPVTAGTHRPGVSVSFGVGYTH